MISSNNKVCLIKIVGLYANGEEFFHQLCHNLWIIIDALEKHRLISKWDTGISQHATSLRSLRRNFAGVVKMCVNVEGVMFLENGAKFRCNPLRQSHRNTRPDPDDFDMLNSAETTHDVVNLAVGQHKRVATGDNYISYFGMLTDIL